MDARMPAKKTKRESYNPRTKAITEVEYGDWQKAFDFFKEHLFKERWLPDVFITYQRRAHSRGYFSPDSFSARDGKSGKHELALNPNAFVDRTDEQIVSTLVHEMTHLWQQVFGKPPSRNYHNKEWAAKMESIGLMPSNTGAVGGKETGQQMTHYIIPGGAYQRTPSPALARQRMLRTAKHDPCGRNQGSAEQGEVHLSGMRLERLGQTRYRSRSQAVRVRKCWPSAPPLSIVRSSR